MGNRSGGSEKRGVRRTFVRLPGFRVHAQIILPRAHPHTLWLLPIVEGLLSGKTLSELRASPPWPAPPERLITNCILHTLLDLRWVTQDWSTGEVFVGPALAEAFRIGGRAGLARQLFDAETLNGEWWAEGLSGTVLSRQTSLQFDWDFKRRADIELPPPSNPEALLDASAPDLVDLVRKLGGVELLDARDRLFLGSPLRAGERKDILFPMFGDEPRLLPNELAELEQALDEHAPDVFGKQKAVRSRVVRVTRSPVERALIELEELPAEPGMLGPIEAARERIKQLNSSVGRLAPALTDWLDNSVSIRPVIGPTQRHFDALAEICASLLPNTNAIVLMTSAFLNTAHVTETEGLADALAAAPLDARFLIVYGHASEDPPERQAQDIAQWTAALTKGKSSLEGRVTVTAGRRRSHEKVLVTSAFDWMVGSWNPASSRPHATVLECSLAGQDREIAAQLATRIGENVEGPLAENLVETLQTALARPAPEKAIRGAKAMEALRRALALLESALPLSNGTRARAWTMCLRAVRAAFQPFIATAHVELIDEHQTRDMVLGQLRSVRHDVLLASDRLADSALDGATLRDLRGDARSRRLVRVVWGREWAGRRPNDKVAREQLERARETVKKARDILGPSLLTAEKPMENHAKLLLVDGLRGLITSENILAYGGEKGRYESRELGLSFSCPAVARHLAGSMIYTWPDVLDAAQAGHNDSPYSWAVAGNEVWHSLSPLSDELDFDWRKTAYIQEAVFDSITHSDDERAQPRKEAWAALEYRLGAQPFQWVREQAERLGLVRVSTSEHWHPYDAPEPETAEEMLAKAEALVSSLPPMPARTVVTAIETIPPMDPLVAKVLADMIRIPAGSFRMGDDRVKKESPRHRVDLTRPFQLGRTPVTQALWSEVMGSLPLLRDNERHPDFPIVHVDYQMMQDFLSRLNARPSGGGFELPTEAQWEYACRAGADTIYCFGDEPGGGDGPGHLEKHAWTKRNARGRLQAVGQLAPNKFGLYDMHGLVYETMRDGFRDYTKADATDPIGPLNSQTFVARGGCWGRFPVDSRRPENEHFRCASRQTYERSHRVSFRLARRIEERG